MTNKLCAFEIVNPEKIEIHLNKEGAAELIKTIEQVVGLAEKSGSYDYDLMTPDWGGEELTSEKCNQNAKTVHHVKLMVWPGE